MFDQYPGRISLSRTIKLRTQMKSWGWAECVENEIQSPESCDKAEIEIEM